MRRTTHSSSFPMEQCTSLVPSTLPELLTTFSPGPVVVTQVTSGRSSIRSSPMPRRSSTRSAPGGTSPRRHRTRTPSVRGGPVHVVEVESDSITTPRVEIESPSKSLASIRMSLRGDTSEVRQSPPLSLPCDTLEPPATPAPNEMSQSLLPTDFQVNSASTPHLLPQTYVISPIQALPQPLAIDPAHSVQLHAESPINTVSYTVRPNTSALQLKLAQFHRPPQICTAPQVHVVMAAPNIINSQAPPTQTQIQNTPQIHIESEDHLVSHIQEAPQVLRVHEPLMHPEALQQQ
ncbi:myb-like protein U [Palaemon carinicauda]|uniref:myb-like protein U n=1 Tax=Palaemon carinicauda TaxID=392227 RepID=UPI0035B6A8D6